MNHPVREAVFGHSQRASRPPVEIEVARAPRRRQLSNNLPSLAYKNYDSPFFSGETAKGRTMPREWMSDEELAREALNRPFFLAEAWATGIVMALGCLIVILTFFRDS
jgi:hypothetical protein